MRLFVYTSFLFLPLVILISGEQLIPNKRQMENNFHGKDDEVSETKPKSGILAKKAAIGNTLNKKIKTNVYKDYEQDKKVKPIKFQDVNHIQEERIQRNVDNDEDNYEDQNVAALEITFDGDNEAPIIIEDRMLKGKNEDNEDNNSQHVLSDDDYGQNDCEYTSQSTCEDLSEDEIENAEYDVIESESYTEEEDESEGSKEYTETVKGNGEYLRKYIPRRSPSSYEEMIKFLDALVQRHKM